MGELFIWVFCITFMLWFVWSTSDAAIIKSSIKLADDLKGSETIDDKTVDSVEEFINIDRDRIREDKLRWVEQLLSDEDRESAELIANQLGLELETAKRRVLLNGDDFINKMISLIDEQQRKKEAEPIRHPLCNRFSSGWSGWTDSPFHEMSEQEIKARERKQADKDIRRWEEANKGFSNNKCCSKLNLAELDLDRMKLESKYRVSLKLFKGYDERYLRGE